MEKEEDDVFYSPEKLIICEEKDVVETNSEELKKLHLLRATLEKEDPSCKDMVDESTMRRFLRARDLDVEKACLMLMKYVSWRRNFVPKGYISESEVGNEIAQNKMFAQGHDKQGRPISVVFGAKHFQTHGGLQEFRRFLVFALDKLCPRNCSGQEKFTIIGDLQGYGYRNSDFRANLAALTILQEYYPERLGKVFIIHVPYVFMAMWKIVYPFIDKNTKKKIVFVEDKKLRETLLEDIDETQLPQIYGGKLQLVPIQNV